MGDSLKNSTKMNRGTKFSDFSFFDSQADKKNEEMDAFTQ
jgi:hypothetical protein